MHKGFLGQNRANGVCGGEIGLCFSPRKNLRGGDRESWCEGLRDLRFRRDQITALLPKRKGTVLVFGIEMYGEGK